MCSDLHKNAKRMQLVQEHQEAQTLLLPDPRWSSTISTSHFLLPPTLRASDNREKSTVLAQMISPLQTPRLPVS